MFKVHVESANVLHIPLVKELCSEDEECTEEATQELIRVLDSLQTAFGERLVDLVSIDDVC